VFFARRRRRRRRSWLAVLLSHKDFIKTWASDCNKKLVVVSLSHEDFIKTRASDCNKKLVVVSLSHEDFTETWASDCGKSLSEGFYQSMRSKLQEEAACSYTLSWELWTEAASFQLQQEASCLQYSHEDFNLS
jgi:hypothetical protein